MSNSFPQNYTKLEYIESSGGQYIDTTISPNSFPIDIDINFLYTQNSAYGSILSAQAAPQYTVLILRLNGSTSNLQWCPRTTSANALGSVSYGKWYSASIHYESGDSTITFNGETVTNTSTLDTSNSQTIWAFMSPINGGSYGAYARISNLVIKQAEVIVRNFIPVKRNSDGEIGMYDTVNDVFYTNSGTGTFIAGPEVHELSCYKSVILSRSENLWNMNDSAMYFTAPDYNLSTKIISSDGKLTVTNSSGSTAARTYALFTASQLGLIDGETYTIKVWSDNFNTTDRDSYIKLNGSNILLHPTAKNGYIQYTWTQANAKEVVVGMLYATDTAVGDTFSFWVSLVKGSTAPTEYIPYLYEFSCYRRTIFGGFPLVDIQGATTQSGTPTPTNPIYPTGVEPYSLNGIGTYIDTYTASNHLITRNVGVKVLDGTENWVKGVSDVHYYYNSMSDINSAATNEILCTHFNGGSLGTITDNKVSIRVNRNGFMFGSSEISTLSDWRTYLAEQYSLGTPVTVYYPLATSITEEATPYQFNCFKRNINY